jgi:lysophospholipase L1-like esterase
MERTRRLRFAVASVPAVLLLPAALFAQNVPATHAATAPTSFRFAFASALMSGFTPVDASARYSDAVGYGFEDLGGGFPKTIGTDTNTPIDSGYLTGAAPFYFSVKVPEGNYRVTVHLGSVEAGTTTVKAELRRLMLEQIPTRQAEHVTRTFAVNVHKPPILDENGKQVNVVRLSGREAGSQSVPGAVGVGEFPNLTRTPGGEGWSWDDTLTLEFSGKPVLRAIEIVRDDSIHNVFICGDSTVCDQPAEPYMSWGQVITRWIGPDFAVSNYALSGNTAAAFYSANRMAKIVSLIKPGDYVLVQYGHNDMKSTAADALASYKGYYERFVKDTRAKGGTPILLTPVSRETFDTNGKITNSFLTQRGDDFPKAVREVAAEQKANLIDLQPISAKFYETLGPGAAQAAFANASEKTHHSAYGAYEIAKCVMQGIVDLKLQLARSVTEDWKPFDPAKPDPFADFKLPPDPVRGATPAGN